MKFAYIMRGIPGSGKSSLGNTLAGPDDAIHSTADYFGQGEDYHYNEARLSEYHAKNYQAFCDSLSRGTKIVICDNTNACHYEYEKYVEAAELAGYFVVIMFIPHPDIDVAASRNVHGVPAGAIKRMIDRWQY